MYRPPPIPTRTEPLVPYTTLFRSGVGELDDALCAAAGEAVAVVGHARERIEADRLRRDVDPLHGVVERIDTHDVGGLVDRMEVDRLLGTDDQTPAVGLAPDAELAVAPHQRFDSLPPTPGPTPA